MELKVLGTQREQYTTELHAQPIMVSLQRPTGGHTCYFVLMHTTTKPLRMSLDRSSLWTYISIFLGSFLLNRNLWIMGIQLVNFILESNQNKCQNLAEDYMPRQTLATNMKLICMDLIPLVDKLFISPFCLKHKQERNDFSLAINDSLPIVQSLFICSRCPLVLQDKEFFKFSNFSFLSLIFSHAVFGNHT